MSDIPIKAFKKSLNHIFNCDNLFICLVCKENIKGELNLEHDTLLSNHTNSKKHQNNVKSLFKLCVPTWSGNYAGIVQNLVFDVILEGDESSFVSKTGDDFSCLVCQENIAQGTNPKEITTSIINHIQTDFHLNNLTDGVFWVHSLNGENSFIMFHKYEVYCSLCKQNLQHVTPCPLKRAVKHLEVLHNMSSEQWNNDSLTGDKSVCQSLECLTLSESNCNPTSAQGGSPYEDLDPDILLKTCELAADDFEEFMSCCDSSDESECSIDEFKDLMCSNDNSDENSNESINIYVDDLMCSECGEIIDIYNENADFSMDLHMQKHKPITSINNESDFDYQDNADYVCPICLETIPIFNKNLELSIELHFEENGHEHGTFTLTVDGDKKRFDFLSRVFDSLPDDMHRQLGVFVMNGNEVFCKLCNCEVSSNKNVSDACKVFTDHMLSTFHVDQFKASSQFLTSTVLNYNKQSFPPESTNKQSDIFEKLCEQNAVIKSNRQYLEKRQINYFCTICNKHVCFSPKENTQALNFVLHLNGELHKKSLKRLKKKKNKHKKSIGNSINSQNKADNKMRNEIKTIVLQLSKEFSVVNLNQTFIKERDGNFFCEICQKSIQFSKTGSGLKKHCASNLHNTELKARGLRYVSQLDYKKLTRKYKYILNCITSHFKPHAHYINHNGEDFSCIICNVSIPGSTSCPKKVLKHFYSSQHRQKCFEVTCNPDGGVAQLKVENRTVISPSTSTSKKSSSTTQDFVSRTDEMNLLQKRAKKILRNLVTYSPGVIRKYASFIEARNGNFFCKMCKKSITCTTKGTQLKEHFKSVKHEDDCVC